MKGLQQTEGGSRRLSLWAFLAAAGGVAAIVGVFLPWTERSTLTINPDGTIGIGGLFDPETFSGISHWTGILAFVGGVMALAGAVTYMVLRSSASRKTAGLVVLGAGILIVGAALAGFFLTDSIPGGTLAANEVASAERAVGVYVTAIGGLATMAGALLMLPRSAREPRHLPAPAPA